MLQEAARPDRVSLERVLDVCRSLPVPRHLPAPSWGHDFGGAAVDRVFHFPWKDRSSLRDFEDQDPVFGEDPHLAALVDRLLVEGPRQAPAWGLTAAPTRVDLGTDSFQSLPGELCAAIAMLLPTADVLRARLATHAFWPVFYSQQFWESRFKPSGDRAWLFEARRQPPKDWRALYRRKNQVLPPGLRNRQRIWALSRQVLDLVALAWNDLPPDLPGMWLSDSALHAPNHRVEVAGLLFTKGDRDYPWFHNGCRLVRTQSVAVPDDLARLSVDTAAFGDGVYIVGLSLTTVTGAHVRLGYSSAARRSVDISQLQGLRLAVGSRGIQGLQCTTGSGDAESP